MVSVSNTLSEDYGRVIHGMTVIVIRFSVIIAKALALPPGKTNCSKASVLRFKGFGLKV